MEQDSISYLENIPLAANDSLYIDNFSLPIDSGRIDSISLLQIPYRGVAEIDTDRHVGTPLPISLEQTDGVFALLLLCFLFFSHIYNGGLAFLKENISVLFSQSKTERLPHETTVKENLFTAFLVFQSLILGAICLYSFFLEKKLPATNTLSSFVNIMYIAGIMGVFLFFKFILYKILGYILDAKTETDRWIRANVLIIQILGILYFIPTLLLVYSNVWHIQIAIFIFILFLLAQITLFYRVSTFFVREKFNFLFLIAYLCSIEIIPYVFLAVGLFLFYQNDVFSMLL